MGKLLTWRKSAAVVLLILGLFLLASCDGDGPEPGIEAKLREVSPLEKELIDNTNSFALDLLREVNVSSQEDNLFISPLSIGMSMGMVFSGAVGETQLEIQQALGFGIFDGRDLNKTFNELVSLLLIIDPKVEFQLANSIWYSPEYKLNPSYRDQVMAYYGAEIRELDFAKQSSVGTINRWVDLQTEGHIHELVTSILPETVMYVLNAIYYKAMWTSAFDPEMTEEGSFFISKDRSVKANMMNNSRMPARILATESLSYLEIPYGSGHFRLNVIMPASDVDLDELLDDMELEEFNDLSENADSTQLDLSMPAFKIEFEQTLNEILEAQGIHKVFTDQAELNRLFEDDRTFKVSEIKHKAVIEVDEYGTEASAATSVGIVPTSLPRRIVLNRPFIFMIREQHTGAFLFTGILRNPSK